MSEYIKLEDAKVAIREKFKSIEDRVEINSVLNGLPTLDITEYADKHQAYSEGYAKGVVYGGLLKSEVSEGQLSKLKSRENSVENTTVSEDFTSISRAKSKLEVSEDAKSREWLIKALDNWRKDSGMITEEQINEAIENCVWRKKMYDVYICTGDVIPCTKHIDDGLCPTLKELFEREAEE